MRIEQDRLMDSIIRIDMAALEVKVEKYASVYPLYGGRSLIAHMLINSNVPVCRPLGRHNKFIIAPGILGGTAAPNINRISMGGKSPLTGGIKESNSGGLVAVRMAKLGIKAVVVEGKPERDALYLIKLDTNGAEIVPCEELRGLGTYDTAARLREKYGEGASLSVIGPAGENEILSACIANTDPEGNPTRFCGRGGMGALMGSKGIKAVVVERNGTSGFTYSDKDAFTKTVKLVMKCVMDNSEDRDNYAKYGTPFMVELMNAKGAFPTRNFSSGRFELVDKISGKAVYDLIEERGGDGKHRHICMPGCVIGCSNIFPDENGRTLVAPLEYETIGMLGSNCGIASLDQIARLNYLCNDYGIDTIETGGTMGVAVDAGLAEFGDEDKIAGLIHEIGKGTILGRLLGSGVARTGEILGAKRVPAVKKQGFAAFDPRAARTAGVLFSTSPMGADHTGGHGMRSNIDQLKPNGHIELSRHGQALTAAFDSLGFCMMMLSSIGTRPDLMADLVNARYGTDYSERWIKELGKDTLRMEREFNKRAGFTTVDDRLPVFIKEEAVPPHYLTFDVPDKEIDALFDFLDE